MRYINLILLFFLSVFISKNAISDEKIIYELQKGGNIIFIRHALAPGSGDPENIDLNDCKTQRNLNKMGVKQSKLIGDFFRKNNIKIDKILSSEWCICKDTAKYAFGDYEIFRGLNSFYDPKFFQFKEQQIRDLKKFIDAWDSENNLVLVTHFVVILEIFNISTKSSEIIVSNKNYKILGRFLPEK